MSGFGCFDSAFSLVGEFCGISAIFDAWNLDLLISEIGTSDSASDSVADTGTLGSFGSFAGTTVGVSGNGSVLAAVMTVHSTFDTHVLVR